MENEYHLRTREISIDQPPTAEIDACVQGWRRWRGGLHMPVWRGSGILLDLPPAVMPFTLIADVKSDPLDFIYRYWGSGFVRMHGFDLTGKSCREIEPRSFAQTVFDVQAEVCQRRAPVLYAGETLSKGRTVLKEFVIRLPLSDDGKTVTKIMSIVWMDMREAADWFLNNTS